jgi:hypothetical protein
VPAREKRTLVTSHNEDDEFQSDFLLDDIPFKSHMLD